MAEAGAAGAGSACVLVTGASSLVARYLVPLLQPGPRKLVLISRTRPDGLPPSQVAHWVRADLHDARWPAALPGRVEVLVHLAPLPLLQPAIAALGCSHLARVIAFGTTSRLTKVRSSATADQRMVKEQCAAEAWLAQYGAASGVHWTLFRPTMIYDGARDKNIALIARFVRRFGFFPLIGAAAGKRQPVHAADLAQACCLALENEAAFGKTYNLSGGEVLSYREMVDRVFTALGRTPRYIRIPPTLLRAGLGLARVLPSYRYLNTAMADRMNKDMVFDSSDAEQAFGYRPRKFDPGASA